MRLTVRLLSWRCQISQKYDIAISFLYQDEALAGEFHDNLVSNFSVFVFSKKLESVGGTDGMETYREVFAKQAKVVVVLYRAGWGKTKFTALEESAIKDFCLNNQFRGLVFVKLDGEPNPSWLPDTHIWIDFPLYKLEKTLGVITLRAQGAGLVVHEESALDRAKRAERRKTNEATRQFALNSDGGTTAKTELTSLFSAMTNRIEEIRQQLPSLSPDCGRNGNLFVARLDSRSLKVAFHQTYGNIFQDVPLECTIYKERILIPGESGIYLKQPTMLQTKTFYLDYQVHLGWHWHEKGKSEAFTSSQLAEHLIGWLSDKV